MSAAAVSAGKSVRGLSRALGRGGGATPGQVAARIDPGLIRALAPALGCGCALVTGTKGKTTTTRIMAGAARSAGLPVITNTEGSNLLPGIAASLVVSSGRGGALGTENAAIGVFEVDEGALPAAIEALRPRLVVITNLFRDRRGVLGHRGLGAIGVRGVPGSLSPRPAEGPPRPAPLDGQVEVGFIARLWEPALRGLAQDAFVVLNADDPVVAYLGEDLPAEVVGFGLDDRQWARPGLGHVDDSRRCPRCGRDLRYELSFYAHLGHYACADCGWRRPGPRFAARRVDLSGTEGGRCQVATPVGDRTLALPLAGLCNACNALAAAAGASCLGVDPGLEQAP